MSKNRHQPIAIVIFFLCAIILTSCCAAEDTMFAAKPVEPAHQECFTNDECALVLLECSGCDCGTPVNIHFHDKYSNEMANRCGNYHGMACDIDCGNSTVMCENKKCVVK